MNLELLTEDFFSKELNLKVVRHSLLPINKDKNLLISFEKDIKYPENAQALQEESYKKPVLPLI